MDNSVKDRLDEATYELLKLPTIDFPLGEIEFFDKDTIDEAQAGFRYNSETGEKIEEWPDDKFVIVGYDGTAGCGPDPYFVDTSNPKLPVYWFVTDGGDWANPDCICRSLEEFNKTIKVINDYSDTISNNELTEETKEEILKKIHDIQGDEISYYWGEILNGAMEFDDEEEA